MGTQATKSAKTDNRMLLIVASLIAARISRLVGIRRTLIIGAVCMLAGIAFLLLVQQDTAFILMIVQLILLGFGLGLIVPIMTSSLLGIVDRKQSGVASGTLNTSRQMGSVIGVSVFGSLVARYRIILGLHAALAVSLCLIIGVLTLAWAAKEKVA